MTRGKILIPQELGQIKLSELLEKVKMEIKNKK